MTRFFIDKKGKAVIGIHSWADDCFPSSCKEYAARGWVAQTEDGNPKNYSPINIISNWEDLNALLKKAEEEIEDEKTNIFEIENNTIKIGGEPTKSWIASITGKDPKFKVKRQFWVRKSGGFALGTNFTRDRIVDFDIIEVCERSKSGKVMTRNFYKIVKDGDKLIKTPVSLNQIIDHFDGKGLKTTPNSYNLHPKKKEIWEMNEEELISELRKQEGEES